VRETLDFRGDLERGILCGESGEWCGSGLGAKGCETFNGENLLIEDEAELAGCLVGYGFQTGQGFGCGGLWGFAGQDFVLQAGNRAVGDAAGVDEFEVMEVGGYVKGETVRGDAAGDMNADGADLAFAAGVVSIHGGAAFVQRAVDRRTPYPGETADAAGRDAVDFAHTDEGFFHEADKVDGAETGGAAGVAETAEVEDRVADQLAGAMIGDVSAAVDFVESDATACQKRVGGQNVGAVGVAAKSKNRRVFEEEQGIVNAALEAEFDQLRLETKSFIVGNSAEIEVPDHG
jgi:hypothetical protein